MTIYVELFTLVLFGGVCHWLKKWLREQTFASYVEYMIHNPWSTIRAVIGYFIATVTIIATNPELATAQVYCMAILAGYGCDSALNETPEQQGWSK